MANASSTTSPTTIILSTTSISEYDSTTISYHTPNYESIPASNSEFVSTSISTPIEDTSSHLTRAGNGILELGKYPLFKGGYNLLYEFSICMQSFTHVSNFCFRVICYHWWVCWSSRNILFDNYWDLCY